MSRRANASESHSSLPNTLYRWAKETLRPTLLQRDREASFERNHWKTLGQLGVFDPQLPLAAWIDSCCALAKGSLDLPFTVSVIAHGIGVDLLEQFGSPEQKMRLRRTLVGGQVVAAIANAEETSGTDVLSLKSTMEPADKNTHRIVVEKSIATNASVAEVAFVSVWRRENAEQNILEVLMLEGKELERGDVSQTLLGFRTGSTGSLRTPRPLIRLATQCQLGPSGSGNRILRRCFNLERLLIPAALVGVLEGIIEQALDFVVQRQSFGRPLAEHQYVQEKIIALYAKAERIRCLIQAVCAADPRPERDGLEAHRKRLSLLKMTSVEDAFAAVVLFYELFGARGYRTDHLAQKLIRDLLALKMLGGTKEQQKVILFQDLLREHTPITERRTKKGRK